MHSIDDTIAALASPVGPAARAIVRVSGPETLSTVSACFQPDDSNAWNAAQTPRRHLGRVVLPGWRTGISAAVLYWPDTRSYTGGPCAEIALPGAPPLVEAALAALYSAGARPARAGEFTLRAFLAGRLDLLQAEAVLGVIDADDHTQLRAALDQLGGGLSGEIARLREQLLLHLADLEAGLDFVEEDIDFVGRDALRTDLIAAADRVMALTAQARDRLSSSGRLQVVLAGLPNAGKSTLFNHLAAREAALVSPQRGTTRDTLCADLEVSGLAITLWDTAGWEHDFIAVPDAAQANEPSPHRDLYTAAAGAIRDDRLTRCDLIVWCTAADLSEPDRRIDDELRARLPTDIPRIQLLTRADLRTSPEPDATALWPPLDSAHGVAPAIRLLSVSALRQTGLTDLRAAIVRALATAAAHRGELLGATAARCQNSLRRAGTALTAALEILESQGGDELISVELRSALEGLGEVCGAIYTDDILDRIFSRFCIGK